MNNSRSDDGRPAADGQFRGYESDAADNADLDIGNMTAANALGECGSHAVRIQRVPGTAAELRVLIVDPDPGSRAGLERLCRANGVRPLPAADTGACALRLARTLRANLLFVDAALSDMTGLELLDKLDMDKVGGVVVTTRTDLAVQAFETGALDYLLRPFSTKRFVQTITRARTWLSATAPPGQSGDRQRRPGVSGTPVLVGERHHRLYLLDPARIEYVEAEGNYVTYHMDSGEYMSRDTLKRLELTLQVHGFLRIENSVLLNVAAIDYVVPFGRGRFVFTLCSGVTLRSTLTYRAGILERLPLAGGRREREIGGIT
jgi:two-component system LytT family response regulator